MPKVCKEIFERTVVHMQHKIKEEKVDRWGGSYISESKGELKVTYEDKLIEIKLLQCYSNLELTLNTNIYKNGIIVGKVYKIELDSDGDILYFLEPEYRLTQPDDTFKEYLIKIQDVEDYIELEEASTSKDNTIKELEKRLKDVKGAAEYLIGEKEVLDKDIENKLSEIEKLNNIIESKNNEILILKEKVECIRNNIINDIKEIMENTTILERLNMNRFLNTLDDLKKY
jgi:esterase/lipase